jgi:ferredoxin
MKLRVNSDACIGCGLCVGTYPDTFEFDDEGKARVIAEIDDASGDEAMANCPVGAIEAE